ncbi:MAG: SDR family NAD(P)-dependent oxidoreductase [Lachnospiraceae bacterium]|nr:SDR family NAD(P)-dependent oxidoreductase [Lachnospiraceae bacterium]
MEIRKTALVTGASGGIGLELAKLFARDGHDLVLVARSEKKLKKLKKALEEYYGVTVRIFVQDLSEKDAALKV